MGAPRTTTLLIGSLAPAMGAPSQARFCIRHGQPTRIDTFDAEGRVTIRSVYDGAQARSNTRVALGTTCVFGYEPAGTDFRTLETGHNHQFRQSITGCDAPPAQLVEIIVGGRSAVTLSGCRFDAMHFQRANVSVPGPSITVDALFVPRLGWPVESTVRAVGAASGTRMVIEALGTAEDTAKLCEAPQS
ncbi:MAG: hypothetical protein ACOYOJ_22410 [Alsobacter sp.]